MKTYDYLVIGSGIMGLSIARFLKSLHPQAAILIIEKEEKVASHASGRNSGVLHAGFYYTADSLKAKFTAAGNKAMKEYCRAKNLPINESGKLVVAQNADELEKLYELEKRGKANGSNIRLIDEDEARALEPNVLTHKKALYSPDTASIDPMQVCLSIEYDLRKVDVEFSFNNQFHSRRGNTVMTSRGEYTANKIINCAGLYADTVAHAFGFGKQYTMIPFKGLYLKYTKNKTDVKMNIYPVPNLKNPFLGVHFTKTVHGDIKIGPTAIPSFWRENYQGMDNFKLGETAEVLGQESRLFLTNSFGFRDLAFEEIKKYNKKYFIHLAQNLVQKIDPEGFTEFTKPGIRAQLLNTKTRALVQDFVMEADNQSIHVLNAVSPAFTCAFPFAEYVVRQYVAA